MIFPRLIRNLLYTAFMLFLSASPQALACNNVHPEDKEKRVTLDLDNVEIHQALSAVQNQIDKIIARRRGLKGTVSIKVDNMLWNEAVEQLLEGKEYYLVTEKNGKYLINNQYCSRIPLPTQKQEKTAEERARLARKEEQRKAARAQWKEKLEQMDKAAAEQQAQKERRQLAEAKARKHCTLLKDKQRQFDEGRTRWYKLDSQGNRIYLSDQEIDASYKKLGQQIRKVCR